MPTQLTLGNNFRSSLFYPIAVASLAVFLAPSAKAYTTWTITIDATGNGQKPAGYSVSRMDSGTPCKYMNSNSDAPKLTICLNDIVQWVASTAADTSGNKKNELFLFQEDLILLDNTHHSIQLLHASDGQPVGGTIDPNASQAGHEYYVAVYDRANKKWYVEDPKIIIGGTNAIALLERIQENCKQLTPFLDKNTGLAEDARDQATRACKKLEEIKIPQN